MKKLPKLSVSFIRERAYRCQEEFLGIKHYFQRTLLSGAALTEIQPCQDSERISNADWKDLSQHISDIAAFHSKGHDAMQFAGKRRQPYENAPIIFAGKAENALAYKKQPFLKYRRSPHANESLEPP
jgi:hypothetical protein